MSINKKILTAALILGTVLVSFVGTTHFAHADGPSWLSCSSSIATCLVYYVALTVTNFMQVIISYGATLINIGLNLTGSVMNSQTVQKGFAVSLSLANLGFVIGIIVIALATILRSETYGVKQVLWKLIVMAILVNFGLVISGALIGFSNNLSAYFLNASGGQASFTNNLMNAFAPQSLTPPIDQSAQNCNNLPVWRAFLSATCYQAAFNLTGSTDADTFVKQVNSMLIASAFMFLVAVTIWAVGILLIIRYVVLGFLIILLPLAWLLWIFPKLSKNFDRWWEEFIRWTFFPAITLFFIYLAFLSVAGPNNIPAAQIPGTATIGPQTGATQATDVGILQTALNEIMLCGLVLGGLFAANSMGIKGAGTAMHFAQAAGNKVKGYAWKKTKQAGGYAGMQAKRVATAPLRSDKARSVASTLQRKVSTDTWMGKAIRASGLDYVSRRAGRALEAGAVAGDKMPKAYDAEVGGLTKEQAMNQLSTSNAPRRQAILSRAAKEEWHDDARIQEYITEDREKEFKSYGNSKTYEELRDKSGLSLIDAIKKAPEAGKEKEKEEKIAGKIKGLASKNPEVLTSFFANQSALEKIQKTNADKGISMPITLQPESLKMAKAQIAKVFGQLSPTNASSFLNEISKKNSIDQFEGAVKSLDPATLGQAAATIKGNDALLRWVEKGSHRTVVNLDKLYNLGLEDAEKKKAATQSTTVQGVGSGESQSEIDDRQKARAAMEEERRKINEERGKQV